MRRLIGVLLLLTASLSWAQTPADNEGIIDIRDFSTCGVVTRFAGNKIAPNCFQNLLNAYLDADYSIKRRNGYAKYNSSPCTGSQTIRGMWPFFATNGTRYLVVQSSNSMFSSAGDGTCTQIANLPSLSATAQMQCVQAMGYLWCTDGVDSPFATNVVSTLAMTGAPISAYIGTFRNRILLGDAANNITALYLSGELNGQDWALPTTIQFTTSAAIIDVSGTNDGQQITCLMGEYQNQYLIGRNYDLYALQGYDNSNFVLRQISNQIGCKDQNTVQEVNNVKMWMSNRGIESYTGTEITRVSYPVDPTIAAIIAASGNSQSLKVNSGNFTQGNLSASGAGATMSSTINPGYIVPSTWSTTDAETAGTFVNLSTTAGTGLVLVQASTASFPNMGAETDGTTNWNNDILWLQNSAPNTPITKFGTFVWSRTAQYNSNSPHCGTFKIQVNDGNGNAWFVRNYTLTASSASDYSDDLRINTSTMTTTTEKLIVTHSFTDGTLAGKGTSVPFIRGTDIHIRWWMHSDAISQCAAEWDADESVPTKTGSYTSPIFDTALSTPVWGLFSATMSSSTADPITFGVQASTAGNGGGFESQKVQANSVQIVAKNTEFVRYISSFTVASTTDTSQVLTNAVLSAETTGYYISPCVTATGNTSWGNFQADYANNGGSFTFYMSTSAVSCAQAIATTANWTAVTPNSIPSITVSSYTAVRVFFNLTVATQTPTLQDMTVNWNAGSSRPPSASSNYNDEYWLFYTTNTAVGSVNDHALMRDFNGAWELFDDITAYSATKYLNQLYLGDSNATGNIFTGDSGTSDNGNNFTFKFQTADLSGTDNTAFDNMKLMRVYIALSAPSQVGVNAQTMVCSYSIDGSTTTYSLGSATFSESMENTGYWIGKYPVPGGTPATGHWFNLTCSNTGANGPISVYEIALVYRKAQWD